MMVQRIGLEAPDLGANQMLGGIEIDRHNRMFRQQVGFGTTQGGGSKRRGRCMVGRLQEYIESRISQFESAYQPSR